MPLPGSLFSSCCYPSPYWSARDPGWPTSNDSHVFRKHFFSKSAANPTLGSIPPEVRTWCLPLSSHSSNSSCSCILVQHFRGFLSCWVCSLVRQTVNFNHLCNPVPSKLLGTQEPIKSLMNESAEALEVGQNGDVNNNDNNSDHLRSCSSYTSDTEPSSIHLWSV